MPTLPLPYGGRLTNLLVSEERAATLKASAREFASVTLDERGLCDLEQLAVGGYSPLTGFLGRADHERVLQEMRLADGTLWPLPIGLPVEPGDGIAEGRTLALRDVYGNLLAFLHVEELYATDRAAEARALHGTIDASRPGVASVLAQPGHQAAGRLEVLRTPPHFDFVELRHTPAELRLLFQQRGWSKVVAVPASRPLHRADEELARRAAQAVGGGLLIHPSVGVPRPGDVDHYTRVRCYRALVDNHLDPGSTVLSLLPLTARHAGPREALLHAILRRNHGCTHLVVSPDLGRPPESASGSPADTTASAWQALGDHAAEIGIELIDGTPPVYLPDAARFIPAQDVPPGHHTATLTATQVQEEYLARGVPLPEWFTRPAVAAILREAHPPRYRQGLTLWFTGLSGSGKSTVAHALVERLAEYGRHCSMLDGDEIRTHLSKGLGFSREDRDTNIRRVGYVAGLVNQHGGTILCSVISPFRSVRDEARAQSRGNFVEIFCDTPLTVCEQRDVKGLYARARAAVAQGQGLGFTGIDDPYEPPLDPEVTLDTSQMPVRECVDRIIARLLELGYILPHGHIG